MSRSLRTALTLAGIALALSACGPASQQAAEAPATTAPATAPAVGESTPATTPAAAADGTATSQPAQPTPVANTKPAQPTPASAPEHRRCQSGQAADGGEFYVDGIKADDADGGLTVRTFAGYDYEQIGLLVEGDVVGTYYDEATMPSCYVTRDGGVWWEIHHPDLPAGGWVNARYLDIHVSDFAYDHVDQPEEEADAHADCVIFYGNDECVVGYYSGGELTAVEPYSAEAAGELHLACVYNGNWSACDVLALAGPGDGIGNALTQTPTEFLVADCANLTGIDQKLACAELATRN